MFQKRFEKFDEDQVLRGKQTRMALKTRNDKILIL